MARFRPMLRNHGLTEQKWRVIRCLADSPASAAGDIASRTFLLAPSLTRILQTLEGEDLVKRRADRDDQRRAQFALTARGRRLFERIAPESEAIYRDIERATDPKRLAALYALLAEFTESLAE